MPFNDYKALVCVFQYGGNDHANTVLPHDATNYALYAAARGAIALPNSGIHTLPTAQTLTNNMQLGLHPNLSGLKPIWDAGDMACLLNVGTLIEPITRAQWDARSKPVPPQLFSHNDQQTYWQTGKVETDKPTSGYGGLMADKIRSENAEPTFTTITPQGVEVFLAGEATVSYAASVNGAILMNPIVGPTTNYGSAAGAALQSLITATSSQHPLKKDYVNVNGRSIQFGSTLASAFSGSAITFVNQSSLSQAFQTVARVIEARATLGVKRQIFLVAQGAYDTHSNLLVEHGNRLSTLNTALTAFWAALGTLGVRNMVTTFTASEFGRTLEQNSTGSDHGWGGHHFIIGGAVDGGKFFGTAPPMLATGNHQIGSGIPIPTTSSQQYLYTLGEWFGVLPADLDTILPNIGNFSPKNLGFMT
jgi:uncharacterized protein (DUF1501 family)